MKHKDHMSVEDYKALKTEHQIQTEVINYLRANYWFVMRLNSGSLPMTDKYGKKRMVKLAEKGTPDLMAFKKELFLVSPAHVLMTEKLSLLFIEIKRQRKKPTVPQVEMMKELESYGARCIVATSVEDLEQQL